MIVNVVTIFVKKGFEDDFIAATVKNHQGSLKEPGVLRFDLLRDESDGRRFLLYEVFLSPEAIEAHRETAHYKEWKEAVAAWMEEPRKAVKYTPVVPDAPGGFRS